MARTAIITGGNTGIGFVTAKALAQKGFVTLLGCRDLTKGAAAREKILLECPQAEVQVIHLDLANLSSVKKFATTVLDDGKPLDVLVNNAGVMACPRMSTADDFEYQFGVNHLGHFGLTMMLLPLMAQKDRPARIVNVASKAHAFGKMDFDDIMREKKYNKWGAYAQSKLANILFTTELSKRIPADWAVTANSLHPGTVATELPRYMLPEKIPWYLSPLLNLAGKLLLTPEQGAETSIYLATSPEVEGVSGKYFEKCKAIKPLKQADNEEHAKKLWDLSLELTKSEDPLPKK